MSDNPWKSPNTEAAADENVPQGVLTSVMVRCLKEASPWIRFIGVLNYIGAVFLVLMGVILIAVSTVSGAGMFGASLFSALPGASLGAVYLAVGVLAFFPARFTYGFGAKIRNYLVSNGEQDLEGALRCNRSLWKYNGVLAIIYMSFTLLVIVVFLAVLPRSAF
jgi:hypothetical protein